MLLFLDREKIASSSTYREDEDATNKLRMKANAGLLFFKTERERERETRREWDRQTEEEEAQKYRTLGRKTRSWTNYRTAMTALSRK